jgi:tetratricopeptide (TPR) repeat protein
MEMHDQLLQLKLIGGFAGVAVALMAIAYRFAPKPPDPGAGIRQIVQDATGIVPPTPGVEKFRLGMLIISIGFFLAGMLLNMRSIANRHGQSFIGWLLIAIFLLTGVLMKDIRTRALLWIHQKLLLADYEGALARADLLLRWFPQSPNFHFMRGTILLFAGRLAEAEQALRTSIEKRQTRSGFAPSLGNLGSVWSHLGRFKEAAAVFQAAAKIYPRYPSAHDGLAEVLLRQRIEPRRALLLVENALKLKQSNPRSRNVDRHSLANMYANRAQALALLGQKDEAASAVRTAEQVGDPAFIPGLAGTRWRCGVALRLMEQENAAIEHFRQAAELDPHGLYGQLADSAMHQPAVHS